MRMILESTNHDSLISLDELRLRLGIDESDEYLNGLLKIVAEDIELANGISLRKKRWKVIHDNHYINLSKGPVLQIISMKNSKGHNLKPLSISRTHENVMLKFSESCGTVEVIYEAGYTKDNLPDCLKTTLVKKFKELYEKDKNIEVNKMKFDSMFSDSYEDRIEKLFINRS